MVFDLLVQLLLGFIRTVFLRPLSHKTRDNSVPYMPPLKLGQVPVFVSSRNRVAQLYPWTLGSICFAFFDMEVGAGILSRLHTRYWQLSCRVLLI
jgi:hypothetical protein